MSNFITIGEDKFIKYTDKNGTVIHPGDFIKFDDEEGVEEVFPLKGYGDCYDLGINATNPEYLKAHPEYEQEFYPLYQFNPNDFVVVPINKKEGD